MVSLICCDFQGFTSSSPAILCPLKLSSSVVLTVIRLLPQTLGYIPSSDIFSPLCFLPARISQHASFLSF